MAVGTQSIHDPIAVKAWQACGCEFCQEALTERGLPLKAAPEPENHVPLDESGKPDITVRNANICRVYAAGGPDTIRGLAAEYNLTKERIRQIVRHVKVKPKDGG